MDKMTCSVDTSQPLSPAIPTTAQWAHKESSYSSRDGGSARAQQQGLPLTKAEWLWLLLSAQTSSSRE